MDVCVFALEGEYKLPLPLRVEILHDESSIKQAVQCYSFE